MADGIIGSVGVSVVPDARAFWERFKEQTTAGAAEAGRRAGADWRRGFDETTSARPAVLPVRGDFGSVNRQIDEVTARLRAASGAFNPSGLSASHVASITAATNRLTDANTKLAAARAAVDKISQREGHTEEELAAAAQVAARAQRDQELAALRLAAAEEAAAAAQRRQAEAALKAAASNEAVDKSAKDAAGPGGGMSKLILAAAALSPALIPIAAVGVPALAALGLGAKKAGQEIKAGLTDEFHHLQRVAGNSLTPGVDALIGSLRQAEPALKQIIGVFGTAFSDELQKLSQSLNNGGLTSFLNYAQRELPVVEDTFNHLLGLAVQLGKALAPLGDSILHGVDNLAKAATGAVKLADTLGAVKPIQSLTDDLSIVSQLVTEVDKLANTLAAIKVPKFSIGDLSLGGGDAAGLNDFYQKWLTPTGLLNKGLHLVQSGFDQVFGKTSARQDKQFGNLLSGLFSGSGDVAGTLRRVSVSNADVASSAKQAAGGVNIEKSAFAALNAALDKYDAKLLKTANNRVAVAAADDSFIAAARGVADSVQANGRSLDALTAKGLANRDAIVNAAQAALSFYDAQRKAGVGARQAAQNLLGSAQSLRATAINAGLGKQQVDYLLRSLHLLPRQVETLLTVDASQAYAVLDYLQVQYAALGNPNGGATTVSSISFIRPPATPVVPGVKAHSTPIPPTTPLPATPKLPGSSSAAAGLSSTPDPLFTRLVQELQAVRQARQQEIQTIQQAVTGTFDITTVGNNQYGEPVTLFDIRSGLQQALRNAQQFEHVLKRLAREGLNQNLLQQLAEAGPQALPQAQALLSATPKQLARINRTYRQLSDTGQQLGKFVGNDLYQAGIQAAQGLVQGLKSQQSALTSTMKGLARSMIRELRAELRMHSPSKRLYDEGALAFEGFRLGIESKAPGVASAAGMVAGKSIPNRAAYKFDRLHPAGALVAGDLRIEQHFKQAVPEPASRSQNAAMRAARNVLGAR